MLNKKFRTAQKSIDREISHTQQGAVELEECLKTAGSVGEMKRVLDGVVEKLTALKRKVKEYNPQFDLPGTYGILVITVVLLFTD